MADESNVSSALAADPEQAVSTIPATESPVTDNPETPATPPADETPIKVLTPEELQKKFDRDAAAQRRRYERDLQTEREQRIRLEERLAQHQPAKVVSNAEPKIEDYADFDEYITAKAQHIAQKQIESTLTEYGQRTEAQKAQAAQQQTVEAWNKQVTAALPEMPDFAEVVSASELPMTSVMQQAIMESSRGPKLAYHLATHPEEALKIAEMTPIGAVRALTLIEEGFKKPVVVTQAAPPITPTGNRSTSIKSLADIKEYDEFSKRRREMIANRR